MAPRPEVGSLIGERSPKEGTLLAKAVRRVVPDHVAERIPGVAALAGVVRKVAGWKLGRLPVGLLALLPVAALLDLFDVGDELVGGPVGIALSFVAETAFVLGITGRPSYALGWAGFDLIPGLDLVPVATITLVREISRAWREGDLARPAPGNFVPTGPVIDV